MVLPKNRRATNFVVFAQQVKQALCITCIFLTGGRPFVRLIKAPSSLLLQKRMHIKGQWLTKLTRVVPLVIFKLCLTSFIVGVRNKCIVRRATEKTRKKQFNKLCRYFMKLQIWDLHNFWQDEMENSRITGFFLNL